MNEYKNGFYFYHPGKEAEEGMHELSKPQVLEVFYGDVYVTGCDETFDLDYTEALGKIGKMVMSEDGKI